MYKSLKLATSLMLACVALIQPAQAQEAVWPAQTYYRYVNIDGHKIFYREAGDPKKPTVLLLHGYPASSHAYRHLIPLLSGRFHVVAPDNLGSGYSDKPDPNTEPYTFDKLADITARFTETLDLQKYAIYMQDFGAPVGFRLMLKQPERLTALITQNGNAYEEGITQARLDFFKSIHVDRGEENRKKLIAFTGTIGVRDRQYLRDVKGREEIMSPDSWTQDLHFLETDEQREIQIQLLQDYQTNIDAYPQWQAFLRKHQPPTLLVWGDLDPAFMTPGAKAFLRDVPDAELHLLDAGHFAFEEKTVEIAKYMTNFLEKLDPSTE